MLFVWEHCGHGILEGQKTAILDLTINKKDDGLVNGSDLREERCSDLTLHTDLQPFHGLGVCP